MKRTLLEVLGGLAVLVVLASFHHQIGRLQEERTEVTDLRVLVDRVVAGTEETNPEEQDAMIRALDARLADFERRLSEASLSREETTKLRREFERTRRDADRFQSEISRDVTKTREMVSSFQSEVRDLDRRALASIGEANHTLRDLSERINPNRDALKSTMLAPTVQLNGDDTVGSGTLVFSGLNTETDRVESYVLTSYHVIRNILADTPSARRLGVSVTIYIEGDKRVEERGDMICHDERIDAALLRLRTERRYENVAHVIGAAETECVEVWDPVYALGCPLGNDPIPTQGEVASTQNRLNGSNYWMINAPTYFGNSGGGIYLGETRELIGVFSKIYTHGKGNPVVVPHMGLCTPMNLIRPWLQEQELAFVLGDDRAALAGVAAPPK